MTLFKDSLSKGTKQEVDIRINLLSETIKYLEDKELKTDIENNQRKILVDYLKNKESTLIGEVLDKA